MRKPLTFATLLILVSTFATVALADTVTLKNGKKLEGKIVSQTEDTLYFEWENTVMEFHRHEVASVEREKSAVKRAENAVKEHAQEGSGKALSGFKEILLTVLPNPDRWIKHTPREKVLVRLLLFFMIYWVLALIPTTLGLNLFAKKFEEPPLTSGGIIWLQVKWLMLGGFCGLVAGGGGIGVHYKYGYDYYTTTLVALGFGLGFYFFTLYRYIFLDFKTYKPVAMVIMLPLAVVHLAIWKILEFALPF